MVRFNMLGLQKAGFAPLPRASKRALATAAVAGVAAGAWQLHQYAIDHPPGRLRVPETIVEAVAGAIGEMAQITVLYPLDTIKVRCQATEQPAGIVVRELLKGGFTTDLLRKLYAGAAGAAVCSILVGAVHLASYEGSRRWLLKLTCPTCTDADVDEPRKALGKARAASGAALCGAGTQLEGCSVQGTSSLALGECCTSATDDPPLATAACVAPFASATAAAAAPPQQQQHHAKQQQQSDKDLQQVQAMGKMAASFLAAVIAAAATAVVESPIELFRHNAQAGLVQSNFMAEMASTVRKEGVGGLYWGFLPHCFEAWPHDISELFVYGYCKDMQSAALQPNGTKHRALSSVPVEAWDLATGAVSGATAVLVSMPFDTVKTYLQTHGTDLAGRGLLGSAKLFWKTGYKLAARRGVSSLYVGLTPRLMQQVPSAMVCWWAIEAFKRAMLPYTDLSH